MEGQGSDDAIDHPHAPSEEHAAYRHSLNDRVTGFSSMVLFLTGSDPIPV